MGMQIQEKILSRTETVAIYVLLFISFKKMKNLKRLSFDFPVILIKLKHKNWSIKSYIFSLSLHIGAAVTA